MDAPNRIGLVSNGLGGWRLWSTDEPDTGGCDYPDAEYILAAEHDSIVAKKDAEIERLRAALLSGKAFAEDWIAEHGGIDGCDYSDRLAFENMCAALGDTDE